MKTYLLVLSGCLSALFCLCANENVSASAPVFYYISPEGNDNNSGTSASSPWQTLDKVNSGRFNPGDKVLFERDGKWYGQLNIPDSGITFGAYGSGDKPVIHGWKTLTGWTNEGGGLYSITNNNLLETARILTIDGEVRNKGRFPKDEWLPVTSTSGNTSVTSTELNKIPNFSGGQIVLNKNDWIIDVGTITWHSGSTVGYSGTSSINPGAGHGFFMQNHIACLMEFGDWMYDSYSEKLTMYFGAQNPDNYVIKVSSLENIINIVGKSDIVLEDLSIQGSNNASIYLNGSNAKDILIQNCNVLKSGYYGVFFDWDGYPDNITIDNCLFEDTKNIGIYTNASRNITITNNTFRRTGLDPAGGNNGDFGNVAISCGPAGHRVGAYTVTDNKIYNSGYHAIRFSGSNVLVERNIIERYNLIKTDGAGIYLCGRVEGETSTIYTNRIVRRNIISNPDYTIPILKPHPSEKTYGIYFDDRSINVKCDYNILYDNYTGIYIHNASDLDIKHNLIYNSRSKAFYWSDDGIAPDVPIENIDLQHNIIYSPSGTRIHEVHNQWNSQINLGTIDNNYYIKPSEGIYVTKHIYWSDYEQLTFTQWKSDYGYDLNTATSPTASEVSDIYYNPDKERSLNIDVGTNRIDIHGNPITENIITLKPFEGMIVLEGEPRF